MSCFNGAGIASPVTISSAPMASIVQQLQLGRGIASPVTVCIAISLSTFHGPQRSRGIASPVTGTAVAYTPDFA